MSNDLVLYKGEEKLLNNDKLKIITYLKYFIEDLDQNTNDLNTKTRFQLLVSDILFLLDSDIIDFKKETFKDMFEMFLINSDITVKEWLDIQDRVNDWDLDIIEKEYHDILKNNNDINEIKNVTNKPKRQLIKSDLYKNSKKVHNKYQKRIKKSIERYKKLNNKYNDLKAELKSIKNDYNKKSEPIKNTYDTDNLLNLKQNIKKDIFNIINNVIQNNTKYIKYIKENKPFNNILCSEMDLENETFVGLDMNNFMFLNKSVLYIKFSENDGIIFVDDIYIENHNDEVIYIDDMIVDDLIFIKKFIKRKL